MSATRRSGVTALQERKRQATVDHLMQAALCGVMQHGLDVTVEEIARIGGVSRRTVFHHFATRDELLSAAAWAGQVEFDNSLPPYTGDGDWRGWLSDLCAAVHLPSAALVVLCYVGVSQRFSVSPLGESGSGCSRSRTSR